MTMIFFSSCAALAAVGVVTTTARLVEARRRLGRPRIAKESPGHPTASQPGNGMRHNQSVEQESANSIDVVLASLMLIGGAVPAWGQPKCETRLTTTKAERRERCRRQVNPQRALHDRP